MQKPFISAISSREPNKPLIISRFAPSPNGYLHLGHAYSAIAAHDLALGSPGSRHDPTDEVGVGSEFLLRIEDIDGERSRDELAQSTRNDLRWLGLNFREVTPQSQRLASYGAAAKRLYDMGLLYRCFCTRTDIKRAASASGPEGPIYPGTCRPQRALAPLDRSREDAFAARDFTAPSDAPRDYAWRLDMAAAIEAAGAGPSSPLSWHDQNLGEQRAEAERFGDIVLWRKTAPAAYHLAATLDDAADGVTLVTRGRDLFAATHVHRLLQALLDLPVPTWHHHKLLCDEQGDKLAKRRGSASLADRRAQGEDGRALAQDLRAGQLPAGLFLQ